MSVVQFTAEGEPMRWTEPQEEERVEQKPSVGRIVHYQSYGTPAGEYRSLPRAAIITEVVGTPDDAVALTVFNPSGMFFNRPVPYDPDGKPGTWRWPPRV